MKQPRNSAWQHAGNRWLKAGLIGAWVFSSTTLPCQPHAPKYISLVSTPESLQETLDGSALSFLHKEHNVWQRHYDSALKAYREHRFAVAANQLDLAMKQLNHSGSAGERAVRTRLLLAKAFAGMKRQEEAFKLFSVCLSGCKKYFGTESKETADTGDKYGKYRQKHHGHLE
jgi:hypothetical protein